MNLQDIILWVSQMSELTEGEINNTLEFLNSNEDDIIIDYESVPNDKIGDYYNVTVEGPDSFYLCFEKGCNSDYLNLLEFDNDFSINCFSTNYSIEIPNGSIEDSDEN